MKFFVLCLYAALIIALVKNLPFAEDFKIGIAMGLWTFNHLIIEVFDDR